jgi:hypothetical protein
MFNPAGKVLDLYDDAGLELVLQNADRLEKTAGDGELMSPEELSRLGDEEFAAIFVMPTGKRLRKYAMHNSGHTTLSGLYFEKNAFRLPEEVRKIAAYNLYKAHVRHGIEIPPFLRSIEKEAGDRVFYAHQLEEPEPKDETEKEAAMEDDEFLLVREEEDGSTTRMFRCTNVLQCKEAMEDYETNYRELEPSERVLAARALVKQAERYGLEADTRAIQKYASDEYNGTLGGYVNLRVHMLGDGPESEGLRTLLEKSADMHPLEFASELEEFDRITGLYGLWDTSLPDPYASTLGGEEPTVKVGSFEVTESVVKRAVAKTEKLAEMFRPEMVGRFQQDPIATFKLLSPSVQADILERAGETETF